MLRQSLLALFAVSALTSGLAGCRGPDIFGTIDLGEGVLAPERGTLVIEAMPVTRATEPMTVSPLRLDVARLSFPFDFELVGNGRKPGNKLWQVSARLEEDPVEVLLEGSDPVTAHCDEDGDGCEFSRARVLLSPP